MAFNGLGIALGRLAITPATLTAKPCGSVIFLHGTCDTGNGMKQWLKSITRSEFAFPEFRILYPSAPRQPYSLMNGQSVGIWFDRQSLGPEMPEHRKSMEATCVALSRMLKQESESSGIPLCKTVVGGFSTGGTTALHLGYRFHHELAGVFALSSFLNPDSLVYQHLEEHAMTWACNENQTRRSDSTPSSESQPGQRQPPSDLSYTPTIDEIYNNIEVAEVKRRQPQPRVPRLFMSQGTMDPLVKYPWARSTFQALQSCGVDGLFHTFPDMKHDIERRELSLLYDWIQDVLTDKPSNSTGTGRKKRPNRRKRNSDDEISISLYD